MPPGEERARAAAAAREFLAGSLSSREFLDRFEDSADRDVEELAELLSHEPERGPYSLLLRFGDAA